MSDDRKMTEQEIAGFVGLLRESTPLLSRDAPAGDDDSGDRPPGPSVDAPLAVTVDEFVGVDEAGVEPVLGPDGEALLAENGDSMAYGDGGAGKTTLSNDLAFHLAAGDDWLGIPVPKPRRVLMIENEGPRPLFRAKLRRKLEGWQGSPLEERLLVWEQPWARFSFADEEHRVALADLVHGHAVDVVIVGPLSRIGMNEAGTLQEVRDFQLLVDDVRRRAARPVAFWVVHHENKGGKVSGAWEGSGDTLLHVQAEGNGRTRVFVQKARWASSFHGTTLHLLWTDGEGFTLGDDTVDRPKRTYEDIADYVLAHGGTTWGPVRETVTGTDTYLGKRRDAMLAEGVLINAGTSNAMRLWHRDDPARPALPETGAEGRTAAAQGHLRPGVEGWEASCAAVRDVSTAPPHARPRPDTPVAHDNNDSQPEEEHDEQLG
jgi:hypothetical protein